MATMDARFSIGELIQHCLFDYRGVIFDVNPVFQGTEEWYEQVARSRPPKDQPWYHVLVNRAGHTTYVAERNLKTDLTREEIFHPLVEVYFKEFSDGVYRLRRPVH